MKDIYYEIAQDKTESACAILSASDWRDFRYKLEL